MDVLHCRPRAVTWRRARGEGARAAGLSGRMFEPEALGAGPRRGLGAQRRVLYVDFSRGSGSGMGPPAGDTALHRPLTTDVW